MHAPGRLVVARALDAVVEAARPGVTTGSLDAVAAAVIADAGARPSFLGYGADDDRPGFPGVVCLSVNDEVVHGIPGERVLVERGPALGRRRGGGRRLARRRRCQGRRRPHGPAGRGRRAGRDDAVGAVARDRRPRIGGRVTDVAAAVEDAVGDGPYGIVEDYVGHGIGSAMHQAPDVPHRRPRGPLAGWRARGPRLVEGTVLAVEPMLTLGSPDTHELDDGWTAVTDDGSLACHWEHTVALTAGGLWVLTAHDGGASVLAALGAPYGPLD